MLGIYNAQTQDALFHTTTQTVDTDTVIPFVDEFARHYYPPFMKTQQRCYLILDNASIHRSKRFQAQRQRWFMDGIIVHFLPPYSPELNRIEVLWRMIKYEWLPIHAYESLDKLQRSLTELFELIGDKYAISFS